jgi:hypothetical protein
VRRQRCSCGNRRVGFARFHCTKSLLSGDTQLSLPINTFLQHRRAAPARRVTTGRTHPNDMQSPLLTYRTRSTVHALPNEPSDVAHAQGHPSVSGNARGRDDPARDDRAGVRPR